MPRLAVIFARRADRKSRTSSSSDVDVVVETSSFVDGEEMGGWYLWVMSGLRYENDDEGVSAWNKQIGRPSVDV